MPKTYQTRVAAPFKDQLTNLSALRLIDAAINYGSLATLTTTSKGELSAHEKIVRDEYANVEAQMGETWACKYSELIEALVGDDSLLTTSHSELIRRAENCFYGRTRMDTSDGKLRIGRDEDRFESWYAEEYTPKASDTDKQHAREAYEAGMNDPITLIPSPTMARVHEWMNAVNDVRNGRDVACLADIQQEMYEALFGKPEVMNGPRIDTTGELTGIPGMSVAPGTTGERIANVRSSAIVELAHKTAHDRAVDHETGDLMKTPSLQAVDEAINRFGAATELVKILHNVVDQRDTAVERLDNLLLWCKEEAAKGVLAKLGPDSKDIETLKFVAAVRGEILASQTIATLESSGGFLGFPKPPPLSEELKEQIKKIFVAEELAKVMKE